MISNILVILAALSAFNNAIPHGDRIFGGQNATSGQFPYIVAINDPDQFCDGIIIAPNWILTTAQCIYFLTSEALVYVGSHLNQINGTAYTIIEKIPHENYDDWSWKNDIGLIKINGTLEYSDTVQAVELGGTVEANTTCTLAGWGKTESEWLPENLKYTDLNTIALDWCLNISAGHLLGLYLGVEQVCTLGDAGKGACVGDSGGPLVCDGKLAGVLSYSVSIDCGTEMPDVYSRISEYAQWIQTHIQS